MVQTVIEAGRTDGELHAVTEFCVKSINIQSASRCSKCSLSDLASSENKHNLSFFSSFSPSGIVTREEEEGGSSVVTLSTH